MGGMVQVLHLFPPFVVKCQLILHRLLCLNFDLHPLEILTADLMLLCEAASAAVELQLFV